MKKYEKASTLSLDSTKPVIVRIDGHHFSSFTKGWKKPFDERISNSMIKTTEDLLQMYSAATGYTQRYQIIDVDKNSDEITLIFPAW